MAFDSLIRWLRSWLVRKPQTRRARGQRPLRVESLEIRDNPATYIFLLAGFNTPVGNNGMTRLGSELTADTALDAHIRVIDWDRILGIPVGPLLQSRMARDIIANDLAGATRQDKVVLIGHSYGGYLAYSLASKVPGINRPASSLITFDPIDWNYANPLRLVFNQSKLYHALPAGVSGTNVLNFVQRNPDQGFLKLPLQGFPIRAAINDWVSTKGFDDLWGTADDSSHELIDSDRSGDYESLGIYDMVQSALHKLTDGVASPLYARATQSAPTALWQAIRQQFPFARTAQLFRADAAPDTFPELFHDQGRGLAITLATSTRGIYIDPFRRSWVQQQIQISGRVLGWGEAALGNAMFRTLKSFATEMGIERLQWNGRIWHAGHDSEVLDRTPYAKDRFFVGFTLAGSQHLDADAKARFMEALRAAWAEETQQHAGWPVLAVRQSNATSDPWTIQKVIQPEADLTRPTRIGRFTTTAIIGDALTKHGTYFALEMFPARDRSQVDELFGDGQTIATLPTGLTTPNWRWRSIVSRSNPTQR